MFKRDLSTLTSPETELLAKGVGVFKGESSAGNQLTAAGNAGNHQSPFDLGVKAQENSPFLYRAFITLQVVHY